MKNAVMIAVLVTLVSGLNNFATKAQAQDPAPAPIPPAMKAYNLEGNGLLVFCKSNEDKKLVCFLHADNRLCCGVLENGTAVLYPAVDGIPGDRYTLQITGGKLSLAWASGMRGLPEESFDFNVGAVAGEKSVDLSDLGLDAEDVPAAEDDGRGEVKDSDGDTVKLEITLPEGYKQPTPLNSRDAKITKIMGAASVNVEGETITVGDKLVISADGLSLKK